VLPPSEPFPAEGARATLRLAVEPTDTVLRLRYAVLALDEGGSFFLGHARLFADGSAPVEVPFAFGSDGVWEDTGIANAPRRGPTRELEVALPATAHERGEVVLDVDAYGSPCGGPLPTLLGLMLDDVRVE
jgi:hypothetical protein